MCWRGNIVNRGCWGWEISLEGVIDFRLVHQVRFLIEIVTLRSYL